MMAMDWAMGAYGDTGVAEMDGVMGSIYLGDPGVDSSHRILALTSYHLVCSSHTTNYTLHLLHRVISLALSESACGSAQLFGSSLPGSIKPSHPLTPLLEPEPLLLTNSVWNAVRGAAEC
jgi:hypothetical protein